jgi:DNA-binding response OmpR family regulator
VLVTVDTSQTILVVEQDASIRELITSLLEEEGYTVVSTADPESALRLAQERRPAVIVQNLSMPGHSIEELIAAYRRLQDARASIILVSGQAHLESIAAQAGADASVGKPFDLTELLEAVRSSLTHQAAGCSPSDRE